jgi:hypothetical protein
MRRVAVVVGILALLSLALTPVASSATPTLRAGAAVVDITPPAFSATADAAAFPTCPAAAFPGKRLFALQEPYVDVDGSGFFDYPEPFCDANTNGRYDGLYLSGAVNHLARKVHDRIDARAIAVSDGTATVVVVSVVSQGLFENYTKRMRAAAKAKAPGITDVLVSANHNESSPDSVGIYGAPDVGGVAGGRSGIDEYYMDFLVDRVATAATQAYAALVPATLHATQLRLPSTVGINLSHNFPTTDDARRPAAVDPKVGLLQARDRSGKAVFTVMSLAAHNQQIGHSGSLSYDISADWPGYYAQELERRGGFGVPLFLVGDNGSIEDPETVPPVSTTAHPECKDGCYPQAAATGLALAGVTADGVRRLQPIRAGTVRLRRTEFDVPLENNIFKAAAAAGLFGQRSTYTGGVAVGQVGADLRTSVSVVDLGPDLQLIANPGESFPALTVGSHWGIEDAGCPDRANPPVPTWHARARYRFQVGLADDLIGYLIPAWGFSTAPGVYPTTCVNDQDDKDPKGHQHKLETESVGYTASNRVAEELTKLLSADTDPKASVQQGRWLRADGSPSHRPEGAVGVYLADGTVAAVAPVTGFAGHASLRGARFLDYDGTLQGAPDITTHGVQLADGRRVFVDVYPTLAVPAIGKATRGSTAPAARPAGGELPRTGGAYGGALLLAAALIVLGLRRREQAPR